MQMILLIVGVVAGALSGLLGVGGGIIVVPALMFIAGMSQRVATGTSLAFLLAPIGIGAVATYARKGEVSWPIAAILAIGFVGGAFIGSQMSGVLPEKWLAKAFAVMLMVVSLKMFLK